MEITRFFSSSLSRLRKWSRETKEEGRVLYTRVESCRVLVGLKKKERKGTSNKLNTMMNGMVILGVKMVIFEVRVTIKSLCVWFCRSSSHFTFYLSFFLSAIKLVEHTKDCKITLATNRVWNKFYFFKCKQTSSYVLLRNIL